MSNRILCRRKNIKMQAMLIILNNNLWILFTDFKLLDLLTNYAIKWNQFNLKFFFRLTIYIYIIYI